MSSSCHEAIKEAQETIEKLTSLIPYEEYFRSAVDQNEPIRNLEPSFYVWSNHLTVNIYGVTNLKELAVPFLRQVRKDGYKVSSFYDSAASRSRTYHLKPVSGEEVNIDIDFHLATDGATCRYEVIGKKEVEITELRCYAADGKAIPQSEFNAMETSNASQE